MSNPLPLLSGQTIIKILERICYQPVRQRGSHIRLTRQGKRPVTVPAYHQIDRSLLRKILRDADITVETFLNLAKQ
ncbi:MAG: type II toxin-antitoxin system HicA family toxin [bacterium]